jgi:hypothetical protein
VPCPTRPVPTFSCSVRPRSTGSWDPRTRDYPRGISTTTLGSLLKHKVPIRTFAEWGERRGCLSANAGADRCRHRLDRVLAASTRYAGRRHPCPRPRAAIVALSTPGHGHQQQRRVPQRFSARLLLARRSPSRASTPTAATTSGSAQSCASSWATTASRANGPTINSPSCTRRYASASTFSSRR